MTVTLKHVAEKTGLSITTVSRALNGYDDVAIETRAMVHSAANQLGYAPNLNARRLKTQRADAIGLILPTEHLSFSDPFFSDLLAGIVEATAQHSLELNVNTTSAENVNALYLNYIRSRRVDGFIIVRVQRKDPRIELLQQHNIPFVAFGRTEQADHPYVDEDGAAGIEAIIDHLVEMGHRRIACITEPSHLAKSYQRQTGYTNALKAHNIPIDPHLIIEGQFRQRSGRAAANQLLDMPNRPTAIVAVNDLIAIGAMGAAVDRGLTVGQDISITGFDNIMLAEYTNPPLTTVHQPAHRMGNLLCQTLIDIVQGKTHAQTQHLVSPRLVVRRSTGAI